MKIRVLDFETTDQADEKAKGKTVGIVEIGFTDVDGITGEVSPTESYLVNSGIPIPPQARAVHHISDDMVKDGLPPDEAYRLLMAHMEPGDLFCAHNAAFERTFFAGGVHAWICTMICAKHLWEEAPSYSNQALRYWLDIDRDMQWPTIAMPPHRAGPDSYVTAHILSRMISTHHPSSLLQLTNTPVLQKRVMFGEKHRGQLWADMDRGFLEWVLSPGKNFDEETRRTARHWLNKQSGLSGTPFA
ncbi:Exodeoxyribonuclease 10 [Pseudorhizobium banfieldiae]|uniref:Exodeoxyribonuclease 10 n=1 Tax=Pseudorhizobium banfieldiae TaxID=1125847 RepID=L0NFK8_9HYPH|nr:exonuclease domain-containing protein [Pseudorhizobium banfieldiae]CAD6605908.1 DNA polymerase III subunit epsilon [arsenite-oxidising bacterium NT-25]CCF19092.1 Exodeoxyribonuclease 10 [Pseudorhizobium banfieldiae]